MSELADQIIELVRSRVCCGDKCSHEALRAALLPLIASARKEAAEEMGWQPMETAPLETPIEVKMRTDRIKDGAWVATAILHEESDHWTDGATILHYNGSPLVRGFRGVFTGWRSLPTEQEEG